MVAPSHPAPPELDQQADVYAWTNVVARSRLSDTLKLIAFTVTTFANGNGTRVYPGVTRLVIRTGKSRSTVTRALAALRAIGLLELVREGNRRRGQADEYRLIFAPDLLDRLDLRSLEEERAEVEVENERHRAESAKRQTKRRAARSTVTQETVSNGPDPVDNPAEALPKSDERDTETITSTVTQMTPETRFYGQMDPRSTVTQMTPHLRIEHLPKKDTHGSSSAGDPQDRHGKQRERNSHQPGLMTIAPPINDCPRCETALEADGTCFTCRTNTPSPASPTYGQPPTIGAAS